MDEFKIPKTLFTNKQIEELNKCSALELAQMLMFGLLARSNNGKIQISLVSSAEKGQIVSSAEKGQIGEDKVLSILKSKFTVEKVSDQARSGDIHLIHKPVGLPEIRLLIEVKNYKRDVPKAEVDKFIRDINSDSRLYGAVFISLNTKISGEDYSPLEIKDLDVAGRKVFTAYVVGDNSELLCGSVALLLAQIQQHLRFVKSFEQFQAARYTKLYSCANKAFQTLQGFNQQRQLLIQSRDAAHKSLTGVIDGLSSLETILRQHLDKLLFRLHESQPLQIQIKTVEIKILELNEKINNIGLTKAGYKFAEYPQHQTALFDLLTACCTYHGIGNVKALDLGNAIDFKIGDDVIMRVKLWKTKTEISWPGRMVEISPGHNGLFVPAECELDHNWITWTAYASTSKNSYIEALKYWTV